MSISFFKNLSITFLSKALTLLLSVATQSSLAWILGPGERGAFAVCQIFAVLLCLIFVMGLEVSSLYFVSSKKCSLSEGVTNIFVYGGISSLVAMSAGLVFMQFSFSFFDKAGQLSFLLALLTIPLTLFAGSLILLLTSVNEFRWYAIFSSIDSLSLLMFTVVFVMIFKGGVNGAFMAVFFQGLVSTVSVLLFLKSRYRIRFLKPSVSLLKEMFKFGIKFHIGKASNYANIHMGTLVAASLLTKDEVGFFAVASQIMIRVGIIPDTIMTVMLPRVASNQDDNRYAISKLTRLTGVVSIISLALVALFAKPFVMVLFSPAFVAAVPIIQILTIGIAVRSTSKIFEPYLLGVGSPGMVSISSAVTLLANLIFAWLFLSIWGLIGVAIGTTIAYFCGASVLLLGFAKHSHLKLIDILKIRQTDFNFILNRVKCTRSQFYEK